MLTACPLPDKPGNPPGSEARRRAAPGERISWLLAVPRACTGVWTGSARRPCPAGTAIPPDGTDPQCPACARADRGRQIARDAVPGDDGREYLLYLAWFGPDLVKVGLTAAGRGRDRLLEQGAITFTLLAAGPYAAVRQAERLISAAGLASERITARAKSAAWLRLPPPGERTELLTAARARVASRVRWPDQVRLLPGDVTDQAGDFGIDGPLRDRWQEVTGLRDGAVLSGRVRVVIGRRLLLDTPAGPLLCDMRRTAGWAILPVPDSTPPAPAGLALAAGPAPGGPDDDSQQALF